MQASSLCVEFRAYAREVSDETRFLRACCSILADVALGMPVKVTMPDLNGMRQEVLNVAHSFQSFEYVHAIESSFSIKHNRPSIKIPSSQMRYQVSVNSSVCQPCPLGK